MKEPSESDKIEQAPEIDEKDDGLLDRLWDNVDDLIDGFIGDDDEDEEDD